MTTSINILKAVAVAILMVAIIVSTIYLAYLMIPILLLGAIFTIAYLFFSKTPSKPTLKDDTFHSFRY